MTDPRTKLLTYSHAGSMEGQHDYNPNVSNTLRDDLDTLLSNLDKMNQQLETINVDVDLVKSQV